MWLNKLYTIPDNLFKPVEFHNGINFIFGMKDFPEDSLNGIGKSLLLDFLDFALLCDFNFSASTRLNRAYQKSKLRNHFVVLEFEINKLQYKITRSFDEPYKVYFTSITSQGEEKNIRDLQKELFSLVFGREDYSGYTDDSWFRRLIKFFLKIQKISDQRFTDPVKYTSGRELELNQYHLFLLNIDNTIVHQNYKLVSNLEMLQKTLKSTKKIISEKSPYKDITQIYNRIVYLDNQIKKLNRQIEDFRLEEYYNELQEKADSITSEIKSYRFLNSADKNKIKEYNESLNIASRLNTEHVREVYAQFETLKADKIKTSLDEAQEFRSSLIQSRKEFIRDEVILLQMRINKRNNEIKSLESEWENIIKILSSKGAITDLTSAYEKLSSLNHERSELDSQVKFYKDLSVEINKTADQSGLLLNKINDFLNDISDKIDSVRKLISEIYLAVFGSFKSG